MDNKKEKISGLNDELNIGLLISIIRSNTVLIVVIFCVFTLGAYLYLKYTPPVYLSASTVQLGQDSRTNALLQSTNITEQTIHQEIELLRSPVSINESLAKLPLDVSYMMKGEILSAELYGTSPFKLNYSILNNSLYGVPISISFTDNYRVYLEYTLNGQLKAFESPIIDTLITEDFKFKLSVINFEQILQIQNEGGHQFYVVINSSEQILNTYLPKLNVEILNDFAKTIKIKLRDKNARKSKEIVDRISRDFIINDKERKQQSATSILNFIDEQLAKIYDRLYESETQIQVFRNEHKIDDNLNEYESRTLPNVESRIQSLEEELVSLAVEEKVLEQVEAAINLDKNLDVYKLVSLLAGSENEGIISSSLSKLQDLLLQKEQMLYVVKEESDQVKALYYQIEIQKKLIIESLASVQTNISSQVEQITNQLNIYRLRTSKDGQSYDEIEYSRLLRIAAVNESFYNTLVDRKAEYSISKAGYISTNRILQEASFSPDPVFPDKNAVITACFVASLLLSLVVVFAKYLLFNDIISVRDILKHSNVSILGVIPRYKKDIPNSQLLVDRNPKSMISEAFRTIRSNLKYITSNNSESKLISITSTISGEGKTFIAINLGGIIAYTGSKVIILDLDMRKPKIHLGFNVENNLGMSTLLIGQNSVDSCINSSTLENLDFITAGPIPPNPSELILSKKMDEIIEHLKSIYDYIIIDNPPCGLVTDGIENMQTKCCS